MDQHFGAAQRGELACPARVVLVEVGEHDPPYVPGMPAEGGHRLGDRGTGTGRAGVDQGEFAAVAPEIGLADREAQQVQEGDSSMTSMGRP